MERGAPSRRARGLRRPLIAGYTELAPNLARSVIHRQVIGPYDMEHTYGLIGGNIFHGELSVDQLFHNRLGRLRGLPLAYRRPLPGALRNPWRRRRVRHPGLAGGEGGAGRPTPPPSLAAQRDWPPTLAAHHQPHDAGLSTDPEESRDDSHPRTSAARGARGLPPPVRPFRGCSCAARTPIPTCWRGSRSTSSMGAGSAPVARPTSRRHDPSGPYASVRPGCC